MQEVYMWNFTDDDSLYSIEDNLKEVQNILKKNFELLQSVCFLRKTWF